MAFVGVDVAGHGRKGFRNHAQRFGPSLVVDVARGEFPQTISIGVVQLEELRADAERGVVLLKLLVGEAEFSPRILLSLKKVMRRERGENRGGLLHGCDLSAGDKVSSDGNRKRSGLRIRKADGAAARHLRRKRFKVVLLPVVKRCGPQGVLVLALLLQSNDGGEHVKFGLWDWLARVEQRHDLGKDEGRPGQFVEHRLSLEALTQRRALAPRRAAKYSALPAAQGHQSQACCSRQRRRHVMVGSRR